MVIKKCKKWWQYIDLTEKTEKSNRTELIRFGSVTKSIRFGSILQKLAKTEPNRPMLTPNVTAGKFSLTFQLHTERKVFSSFPPYMWLCQL